MADGFQTLDFTPEFLQNLARMSVADGKKIVKALDLLDANEKTPSLQVHQLSGELAGVWSARASKGLRITFKRTTSGRKVMLTCNQHYND